MHIQRYQIHNVLNVYRRQLSQNKKDHSQHTGGHNATSDPVTVSAEGKSHSVMEKVAANVLKKITSIDPGADFGQEIVKQAKNTGKNLQQAQKSNTFIFNTIVGNNEKETRSIAVDNSQVLLNRLDKLAQAAVKGKAE